MASVTTIVFTTHNRRDLLRQAIVAARGQSVPLDILVMDDASTDGTAAMMAAEFPDIGYHRSSSNVGPCYHRTRGIELAATDIVFPLDDDSILQSPHTIEQTLAEFTHDRIGAVAIPFANKLQGNEIFTRAPATDDIYLTHAFVAAAHAVRREVFLKAGGYRDFFFYMGEEGDICIRMLEIGYCVRLGNADPIHHMQPPARISARADRYGRQNDILFVCCNVPSAVLPLYLAGTTLKGLWFGLKVGRLGNALSGFASGYRLAVECADARTPVSDDCFRLFRTLKKRQQVGFAEVADYFQGPRPLLKKAAVP